MNSPFTNINVDRNSDWLKDHLQKAIDSPTQTFSEISLLKDQGLYMIFNEIDLLYVGKTNRNGKIRLRELTTDFRSHSFNRKYLAELIQTKGHGYHNLSSNKKKELIETGILTEFEFKEYQAEVNSNIKTNLKFKFYSFSLSVDLVHLEHYAISVLKPLYND